MIVDNYYKIMLGKVKLFSYQGDLHDEGVFVGVVVDGGGDVDL